MRLTLIVLVVIFLLQFAFVSFGQDDAAMNAQAVALIQRGLAATIGSRTISDVTLRGTVRRISGSDEEAGPAVESLLSTGEAREDFNFPSGPHSEVRWIAEKHMKGQWTGPDGVPHAISPHNLTVDSGWFFPGLLLRRIGTSQEYVVTYAGREAREERTVEHLSSSRVFALGLMPLRPCFSVRAGWMSIWTPQRCYPLP
jgi:hypothetical protein